GQCQRQAGTIVRIQWLQLHRLLKPESELVRWSWNQDQSFLRAATRPSSCTIRTHNTCHPSRQRPRAPHPKRTAPQPVLRHRRGYLRGAPKNEAVRCYCPLSGQSRALHEAPLNLLPDHLASPQPIHERCCRTQSIGRSHVGGIEPTALRQPPILLAAPGG